jgi:hypothetical protein
LLKRLLDKFQTGLSNWRIARITRAIAEYSNTDLKSSPIVFFNASARLGHLSQNAAFSLLSAWGLRLADQRVVHFVCDHGMTRCVLGTNPDDPSQPPPCDSCVRQSKRLYFKAEVSWFSYNHNAELDTALRHLDLAGLQSFTFEDLPLGGVVLPSLRWALRRHHLSDDASTKFLYRQYIISAYNLARKFENFIESLQPSAVILFNGVMYPEAIARHVAILHGVRAITHEVGLLPFSAFFTDGQATAYPIEIPVDFELTADQERQLDDYLSQRFQGQFTMAGIRFWPKMQELDETFLAKTANFKHIVPIFTNVIFDTSQVHANSLFPHMFAWLDVVLGLIKSHPDTLFVIRAHPDELRPGTRKQSRESVAQWVRQNAVDTLPNVVFVDSGEYLSSYALIERAHFVMVYNSSIGLEASIMGKFVLCAGKARYTQYETVFYPASAAEYVRKAEIFLATDQVEQPARYTSQARRVLYFQLFRTSLPFEQYLEPHSRMGYVNLNSFPVDALKPVNSSAIHAIYDGVVNGKPFLV